VLTLALPDSQRRPDLAVSNLVPGGKILLLDVTTSDPSADSNMRRHSYRSFNVSNLAAESRKRCSYEGCFDVARFVFQPLAIELSGRWGPSLCRFFDSVKKQAAVAQGFSSEERALFVTYWRRCLAVGFMRELSRSALSMREHLLSSSAARSQVELAFI
jgi:hypothetical protein